MTDYCSTELFAKYLLHSIHPHPPSPLPLENKKQMQHTALQKNLRGVSEKTCGLRGLICATRHAGGGNIVSLQSFGATFRDDGGNLLGIRLATS